MSENELQVHGPSALGHDPYTGQVSTPPITGDLSPEGLIALAIQRGVPVESFEKLLAMRTQLRQEEAKRQYDEAFARFQAELPIIIKSSTVQTEKYSYKYTPIDKIIEVVQPLLTKHGFSFSFDSLDELDPPAKVCIQTKRHVGGHSERNTFRIEIDPTGRQNKSQQNASAHTYAKRYAFCDGWGVMTGEEDDDSRKAGERHSQLRDGDKKVRLEPDKAERPKSATPSARKPASSAPATITKAQEQLLEDRIRQLAETFKMDAVKTHERVIDHIGKAYGVETLMHLSPAQSTEVLSWMLGQRRARTLNPEMTL
jgi:hypothetical protein